MRALPSGTTGWENPVTYTPRFSMAAAMSVACRARIGAQLSLDDYLSRHDALYRRAHAARASNTPAEAA